MTLRINTFNRLTQFVRVSLQIINYVATKTNQRLQERHRLKRIQYIALPSTSRLDEYAEPEPAVIELSATEVETLAIAETIGSVVVAEPSTPPTVACCFAETARVAPETVETVTPVETAPVAAAQPRGLLVQALLDEAYAQGLRTYPQLIKYVELATGKGCSRRAVATWKASRKLAEESAA
ncbi:hypothetical protein HC928_16085 [bacterium]|nr:hypothetical protein [bacterium]